MAVVLIGVGIVVGPGQAVAQRPLGIDVSSYQGSGVNWTNVKNSGVTFAWAKATEGTAVIDADFTINEANARAAGVMIGAYHYAHPEYNTADAEAAYFWNRAGPYITGGGGYLMPMLDFEQNLNISNPNYTYTQATLSEWVNEWCQDIVNYGAAEGVVVTPVVYTFISYANGTSGYGPGLNSTVTQWPLNMSNPNGGTAQSGAPAATSPWSTWNFWQYDTTGAVPGVSGNCDEDVFNGTAGSLQNYIIGDAVTFYYWDPQGTSGDNPYTGSMTGTWESKDWSSSSSGLAAPFSWIEGQAVCFGVNTGIGTPAFTVTANSNHTFAGIFDGPLNPNSCNVTINGNGVLTLAGGPQGFYMVTAVDGSLADITISNVIAGGGQVVPEGYGQLYLNGTNTFAGGTQLGYTGVPFSGILNFNNNSSFGTGTITLSTLGNGAALVAEGASAITISNPVTVAGATTNNFVGNPAGVTYSGNWSLGANPLTFLTGNTAGNIDIISGIISGSAGLTVSDLGTLVLSGANSYTGGTTISSGILSANTIADANCSIGPSGALTFAGGTLSYTGAGAAATTRTFQANSGVTATIDLPAGNLSLSRLTATVSGNFTINKTSGGTLNLGGTLDNSYTGVNVKAGTVILNKASSSSVHALGSASTVSSGGTLQLSGTGGQQIYTGASLTVISGGVFDLNGITETTMSTLSLSGAGFSGGGALINSSSSAATLTPGGITLAANSSIGGSGNITLPSVISGSSMGLTKVGAGTLTLSGASTYSGNTTISAGTLALSGQGSINSTPTISIAAGATLDVSAIASYTLSSSTTLSASGTSTAATLKGGATVSLGSQPVILACDGSHPALTISQGALSLNGNAFTVNGSVLAGGAYTIIQAASGNTTSSGSYSVSGTAVPSTGATAAISVSGGNVILTITDSTTTALNSLTPTTYGQSVTFTATVSPAPSGGTVQFYDNGVALGGPVTVSGGTASYATNTLSVGNHPITASYSGVTGFAASSTASSPTQQVTLPPNSIPVTINGATILGNGSLQLNFTGVPGYTYWIQATTNLNPPIAWTTLSTNTADINGLFNFIDLGATNYNGRYYQTALP